MTSRKLKIANTNIVNVPEGGDSILKPDGSLVKKGSVDAVTGEVYSLKEDSIVIAGSKSSLKRMNLLERNIIVLAKKQSKLEEKLDKIIKLLEDKNET